uniref:Aminotransferase-like plant mobile domain-containing protein n=1 Tax=Fagus sylvatica TaxID=28930 RepID=A0A2N9GCZ9_FAGSY
MSDFDVLGTVGKLALPTFCKVLDSLESERGFARYGSANRGHRSVFGPFEDFFPIGIPARPGKILAIREFHVVHECVFISNVPGLADQLVASQEDSARKRGNVGGKVPEFSAQPYFRRPVFTCVVDIAPDIGFRRSWYRRKACATYFSTGVVSSIQLLVRSTVRSNLGQTSRVGNGSVKPRSTLGQLWSNLVNLGKTWLDFGKCAPDPVLSCPFFVWRFLAQGTSDKEQMTRFLPTRIFSVSVLSYGCYAVRLGSRASPSGVQMDIPRVEKDRMGYEEAVRGSKGRTPIDDPFSPTRPTRCQVEVVVVGASAGPIALRRARLWPYEPESPPDTDDEYDAMEDVRTHADASIARNLQAELDAEAAGLASAAPPARSKRQRSDRTPLSADPVPEDYAASGFRYPPRGGIRPRYPVATPVADTPLLTGLHDHPSSSVIRCEDPPASIGRGGWSDFCQLLEIARPEYKDLLAELGFGPLLSIRYVHVWHPLVRCWVERIPPSDPVPDFEALEILGIADPATVVGKNLPSLRISYLKDLLRREIKEPPTELRYRQWTAYFIFSCFLGNDKSTIPTPIIGMFRDIDALRDYDWGALTYGFYIRGLRRFSRRQTASFLGFWQFTLFWAFEHFLVFAPSRLPAAPDSVFPLTRRDIDIVFQPYSSFLVERPEVFRAVELSHLRIWIRSPRSWELLMGEKTMRQMGGEALVPVDSPRLMTIEDYIPRAPSDSYVEGVEAYPDLIQADVPYQEWFERVSLGSLMSLHEVEGGRVMGGTTMDSHVFQSSGEGEMARMQMEATQHDGEMAQMQADLVQRQRDLDSRDAELAIRAATIRRLEEQLQGVGIPPVTGAGSSGFGQTSSPPPPDPVSRDWFFDDPPSL